MEGSRFTRPTRFIQAQHFLRPSPWCRKESRGKLIGFQVRATPPTREGDEEEEYIHGISGPEESSDEIRWNELTQLDMVGETGWCTVENRIES